MTMKLMLMPGLALAALLAACSPASPPVPAGSPAKPAAAPAASAPLAAGQIGSGAVTPPTVNGVYIDRGACPGEGCYLGGKIRALAPTPLLAEGVKGAATLATLAEGEWVEVVDTVDRLIPTRGTVKATGEVVYMLGYEGEGCSTVWNKGKLTGWCDDGGDPANSEIAWDPPTQSKDPTLGFWVQVKRTDGMTGWLGPEGFNFACTGQQDRDPDCPPLPQ